MDQAGANGLTGNVDNHMWRLVWTSIFIGGLQGGQQTIQGYEAMHMLRKGQLEGIAKGDVLAQNQVINQLVGLVA